MPSLRFARIETSLGPIWVAETDAGVAAATRSDPLEAFLAPLRRRFPDLEPLPAELDAGWARRRRPPARRPARPARVRRARVRGRPGRPARADDHVRRGGGADRVARCRARRRRSDVALPALPCRALPSGRASRRRLVGLGRRRSAEAAPAGGRAVAAAMGTTSASTSPASQRRPRRPPRRSAPRRRPSGRG